MKLMEILNNSNINCPKPLKSKKGSHLINLKNRFTISIDEVEIIKENVVFKIPKKLN